MSFTAYFDEFPAIFYSFQSQEGKTYSQVLTDITLNTRFRKNVLDNIALWDEYDIKDGETPEIIAEKFYGNPEYHWTVMLANQRYDITNDFPLTSTELYNRVVQLYGEDNINGIHHFEINGIIHSPMVTLKITEDVSNFLTYDTIYYRIPGIPGSFTVDKTNVNVDTTEFSVDDTTWNTNPILATAMVMSSNQQEGTVTAIISKGAFISNSTGELWGVRVDPVSGESQYRPRLNFNIETVTISEAYTPITNYGYEDRLNEAKRRIKIISPRIIERVVNEFKSIMG